MTDVIYLGVDGGGSKCKAAIVAANGEILGEGVGGPANPYQNYNLAIHSIMEAAQAALSAAGFNENHLKSVIAGGGLAGLNVPSILQKMESWQHPFKKIIFASDAHIACVGAHGQASGAIIIAGTGSCGYAFVNQQAHYIGGYGFPIGDTAGGAWIGLKAVQAALLAYDKLGPETCLVETIASYWQLEAKNWVERLRGAAPADFAHLVTPFKAALERKDAIAKAILADAANYLSALVLKLSDLKAERIAMIGGLSDWIGTALTAEARSLLAPAYSAPEIGAALMAQQNFTGK